MLELLFQLYLSPIQGFFLSVPKSSIFFIFFRERTASDEIEVLWQEFESLESKLFQKRNGEKNSNLKSKPAKNSQDEQEILKSKPTKNSQDEQEIEGLKTTIGILTTQLQKDKNNFVSELNNYLYHLFTKRSKLYAREFNF